MRHYGIHHILDRNFGVFAFLSNHKVAFLEVSFYCYLGVMSGLIKCNIFTFIFWPFLLFFKSHYYYKKIPMTLWIFRLTWCVGVKSGFIKLTHCNLTLTPLRGCAIRHHRSVALKSMLSPCGAGLHTKKKIWVNLIFQWVNFIKPENTVRYHGRHKIHSVIGIFFS